MPDTDYIPAEVNLSDCYAWRTFHRFAQLFGLIDIKWQKKYFIDEIGQVKASPLLAELITFNIIKK